MEHFESKIGEETSEKVFSGHKLESFGLPARSMGKSERHGSRNGKAKAADHLVEAFVMMRNGGRVWVSSGKFG